MPNWYTTPLVTPEAIKPLQDRLDSPSLERSPMEARIRGFGAGALEGLRGFTSPAEMAGLAALAVPGIGMMRGAGRVAESAPRAIRGLSRAIPAAGEALPSIRGAARGLREGSPVEFNAQATRAAEMRRQQAIEESLNPTQVIKMGGNQPPVERPYLKNEMTIPNPETFESQLGSMEKGLANFEVVQGKGPNASGESAASGEALSRMGGMKARGEQYVVIDRAGQKRPLIGPEAVDYNPRPGETYGVEGPTGFRMLSTGVK